MKYYGSPGIISFRFTTVNGLVSPRVAVDGISVELVSVICLRCLVNAVNAAMLLVDDVIFIHYAAINVRLALSLFSFVVLPESSE